MVVLAVAAGRGTRAAAAPVTTCAVPRSPEVDLVDHVLARCGFGAAPGERERVRSLASLERGRGGAMIPVVHDYHDVLAAVLARHGPVDLAAPFPGHRPVPMPV